MQVDVNYLAVFLAGASSMLVGSFWYSMKVFGARWAKLARVDMTKSVNTKDMVLLLGTTFVISLVTAYTLAFTSFLTNHFFQNSFLQDTLMTALWLWLGFTALRFWTHDLFEGRPRQLTLLNIGNEFVTIMLMALVIGLMKP